MAESEAMALISDSFRQGDDPMLFAIRISRRQQLISALVQIVNLPRQTIEQWKENN